MTPGKKVKEIRENIKHLTQAEFADEYGLKLNTVRFVEQEKQDVPDELALILEEEYKIPFKWWKTAEGPMYIEHEDYIAATGTYNCPHLRVIKSDHTVRAEIINNIGIAEKEIETVDDEQLKQIAKKLGRSIMVEYVESDKTEKICEVHPDGRLVEASHQTGLNKADDFRESVIMQYLTELETRQLIEVLKNNKAILFMFIEAVNNDPQAVKKILLNLEN